MVIMDPYYSEDRLREIWQNIEHLHLSYLEMEESPEKLDHRIRLEDCIREFLSIVAHSQKFCFRETAEVLYRSASNKKDFSGYKAATGFNAIQLYAGNLLSQPWRKEYRQLKTYCGFYVHQVEANLVGADIMFEAMGYKHCGNGILVLDGPICPDLVASVSKDCLVAYVECQILKSIWEELSQSSSITWQEVLEFRKSHLCSSEQSIRALNYQFHQKQFQSSQSGPQPMMPYQPIMNHTQPAPAYAYPNTCCAGNSYGTYAHTPYMPVAYPQPITNGYYCPNGYVAPPPTSVYGYGVPTGQLIELDNTNINNSNSYEMVDKPASQSRTNIQNVTNREPRSRQVELQPCLKDEDWDFVYRNLESKGYCKDLGERGDVLSPNSRDAIKKTKPTNLDEAILNLSINSDVRPLKFAEVIDKFPGESRKSDHRNSQGSSYENVSGDNKKSSVNNGGVSKVTAGVSGSSSRTKTLPVREKPASVVKEVSVVGACKTLDLRKVKKWECKYCTYLNENTKDICEMCSKSRVIVEQQMEIGGAQCSQCTLVNCKEAKLCRACGESLKDSPTYI